MQQSISDATLDFVTVAVTRHFHFILSQTTATEHWQICSSHWQSSVQYFHSYEILQLFPNTSVV